MFKDSLKKRDNKKFKKLLECSVVFLNVDDLKYKNKSKTKNIKKTIDSQREEKIIKSNEPINNLNITTDNNLNNNFISDDILTVPPQTKKLFILLFGIF